MASLWILVFIVPLINRVSSNYHCTMQAAEVTCFGMNSDDLAQQIIATVNKTDFFSFNLTDGIVSTILPSTFKEFTSLKRLYLTNTKLLNLEDNSLSYPLDLTHLYLNNNTLNTFNIRSLPPENGLSVLDLSYNMLNDFSNFNISYFPKLSFLNLANNFLTYLPVDLLAKIEEDNQFFLVVDNNPWDCNNSNWSGNLTENLINAFCVNNTFDYLYNGESETTENVTIDSAENTTDNDFNSSSWPPIAKVQDLGKEADDDFDLTQQKGNATHGQNCEKQDCLKCSFYFCLYWFFGGIWLGIIIGNIPKLKSLICSRSVSYSDQSIQCDQLISDQYMVSGFRLDFSRKNTVDNKASKTKEKKVTSTRT